MKKIGIIGVGIMGRPMAINLLQAGYVVAFYARRREVVEDLETQGAKAYPSAMKLAEGVDVIITNVSTTQDVEEILLGDHGVIQGAKPGCVVIDMSTIAASKTQQIATKLQKRHIDMLDAPVSGGEQGAMAGTLTIMVGGKAATLAKVMPILEVLGKRITHIGDHGAGQVAKACNQIIIAETILAVSESLRLAKSAGVDPYRVREALLGGFANSQVLEVHGKRMLDENYTPGFKASLHCKDMHLALELAYENKLELIHAAAATAYLDHLVAHGQGELDSSAIHTITDIFATTKHESAKHDPCCHHNHEQN